MPTNLESLKLHIYQHQPILCTICESNSKVEDDLENAFPYYDIIRKMEDNHPLDHVIVLVKKNTINYERVHQIEDDNIASIWLKVRTGPRDGFMFAAFYRQWRLPAETGQLDSG